MTFEDLDLIEPIRKALVQEGYTTPTPIQSEAIPIVSQGYDLLGCAQTGTGKTAAFSIPIIQRLYLQKKKGYKRGIKALILTPTRELAIQIGESFAAYGRFAGLRHTVIFGGVGQKPQTEALERGIDILIATPGRLLDLIGQGFIHLDTLEYFVLDEADRMLDMGFIHDIKRILPLLPKKRQSLFFSATMPGPIRELAETFLKDPEVVKIKAATVTIDLIEQEYIELPDRQKFDALCRLLDMQDPELAIVFVRTKRRCDEVTEALKKRGYMAEGLHGDLSQQKRDTVVRQFKEGTIDILVATDVAARGLDISGVTHVYNFDMPQDPEIYVHRVGRTGRAGQTGLAEKWASCVTSKESSAAALPAALYRH